MSVNPGSDDMVAFCRAVDFITGQVAPLADHVDSSVGQQQDLGVEVRLIL